MGLLLMPAVDACLCEEVVCVQDNAAASTYLVIS